VGAAEGKGGRFGRVIYLSQKTLLPGPVKVTFGFAPLTEKCLPLTRVGMMEKKKSFKKGKRCGPEKKRESTASDFARQEFSCD